MVPGNYTRRAAHKAASRRPSALVDIVVIYWILFQIPYHAKALEAIHQ